jgi:hypothetical protein
VSGPSATSPWQTIARALARPWAAVALAAVLAALVLLPGLGSPGLWEPQELVAADTAVSRAAARRAAATDDLPDPPAPPTSSTSGDRTDCPSHRPPDALARSLNQRALEWTARDGAVSEGAMRRPMAALGIVTVVATAALAARLAGGLAALLTALLLLSFPLLVLQARQLTSELGTAAGAALTLYGLVSLRPVGRTLWRAVASRRGPSISRGLLHLADDLVSLAALAAGLALGFVAGGALLGTFVSVVAFAAATGLGARGLAALARLGRFARRAHHDHHDHPAAPRASWVGDPTVTWLGLKGLVATAAALALAYLLVDHAYKLGPLTPGTRQVFGHSILPTQCYSWALGGIWQASDDLRILYDSKVEQIAFGTFPWGLLALPAMLVLLSSKRRPYRLGGALCLAWAGAAWIAAEAFQRKVGFTNYAGFPALALAVALWLDAAFAWLRQRAAAPADAAALEASIHPAGDDSPAAFRARIAAPLSGRLALGLFFLIGALTLGKDLTAFADRLTSLLLGDEAVKYPALARFLFLPPRVWAFLLGLAIAAAAALWLWGEPAAAERTTPSPTAAPRWPRRALAASLAATLALSLFWVHGWQGSLSKLLSSKGVFATYRALRQPGDRLVVFGDLGNAPRYYAGGPFQQVPSRDQILTELAAKERVFALVPAAELCALHRQATARPYYVLDNDNARTILVSNSKQGATDRNPLAAALYRSEPPGIANRPPSPINFDDRIEIIGWNVPAAVRRGERFEVTIYYKILAPIGGNWKVFQHWDRGGARFIGDHVPIDGRCPTADWQAGDYIVDRFTLAAGTSATGPGTYDLWTGFFTGAAPSWRNMKVKEAPSDRRDAEDRVKLTSITLK